MMVNINILYLDFQWKYLPNLLFVIFNLGRTTIVLNFLLWHLKLAFMRILAVLTMS